MRRWVAAMVVTAAGAVACLAVADADRARPDQARAAKPPATKPRPSASATAKPRSDEPPAAKPPASAAAKTPKAAAVSRAVRAIHQAKPHHADRLDGVSSLFLGARYQLSPLGEGARGKIDSDPIVRYDAFDCVTYVEQVMALSWLPDHERATAQLQQIRYRDGKIGYGTRKHIMMAQWIPQNIRAGFVRDVTAQVGGKKVTEAWLTLDHTAFESTEGRALSLSRKQRPIGRYSVPIIPIHQMAALIDRIPHGTIITSIRTARTAVPYRASHVGLVVVRDGKRLLRHAYKKRGQVVELPLRAFVERSRRYRSWPMAGFNLLAIAPKAPSR